MIPLRPLALVLAVSFLVSCDDNRSAKTGSAPKSGSPSTTGSQSSNSGAGDSYSTTITGTKVSKEKAMALAKAVTEEKKINLELFEAPKVRFDSDSKEWRISYAMKPPIKPGGHFMVTVNEAEETQFIAGR